MDDKVYVLNIHTYKEQRYQNIMEFDMSTHLGVRQIFYENFRLLDFRYSKIKNNAIYCGLKSFKEIWINALA